MYYFGTELIVYKDIGAWKNILILSVCPVIFSLIGVGIVVYIGEKRIELHFLQKNSSRVIVCKNTISESVLKNNKELKSTKHSSEFHGLGHQIVESTVQKYNGLVNYYEDEDGMFGVQIVIPI